MEESNRIPIVEWKVKGPPTRCMYYGGNKDCGHMFATKAIAMRDTNRYILAEQVVHGELDNGLHGVYHYGSS